MTTPPLLDLPTSFSLGGIVMTMMRVTGLTTSNFSFEENTYQWPGERWSIRFQMPPINDKRIASEWISFGLKLKGRYGRFLIGDPSRKVPMGVATGTPLVSGGGQTGNTLVTDGWTPSTTGIMKMGDYIQLGTGTSARLHMVVSDANSNGSGVANLEIEPALRASPADNAAIIVQDAKGLFRIVEDDFSWSADPQGFYNFSFEAVEVVNA